jgi:L-iditol 2-dehydrogenase
MFAAQYYAPGQVTYEKVPVPMPGPGELLVQVQVALTCGTDVKCLRRGHPVLLKEFPSPFGHECAGIVVAVGDGVERFSPGDRVVAANSAPCYNCRYCRKGKHNLCEHLDLLNGAYAQYLLIPERIATHNTHRIPEHLPFESAAFAEPLAVSYRGIELSNVMPGDHVAIMGLGAIGQLLVWLAKWKGAHVTAMARNPLKRALAREFGQADAVVDLSVETDSDVIRQHYTPEGEGFDVVIEAIGLPHTWEQAVQLVRKGGTVNWFGGCPGGSTVSIDTRRIHYDEITLISLFHHTPHYFKKSVDLLSDLTLDPRPLISAYRPLSQFEAALGQVEAGRAIKIALQPDSLD